MRGREISWSGATRARENNRHRHRLAGWLGLGIWLGIASAAVQGADPFAENVRSTPWLSPAEEQRRFHLPPGFEIRLFAAEPDIAKPMNMAFDDRGRLWVTTTVEYPYPVPLDKPGRDSIRVLEDTDGDGRADRTTTFAEGLNIPIGLYPYRNGVVAWSIPHIWWLEDNDGDGRADRRERLYGPLGWERDAHGMNSSFTRGFDGWLYATHGFNNDTVIRGTDGSEVRMNSGNTYRIRLDGSRVEPFAWGQVNPFGLCFDPAGRLFSADCHSEPIYQLLRGGHYPSFGKPHGGLGFAPAMIFHGHGSTAISGIAHVSEADWPEEFHGNLLTGNVMTSRINRDAVTYSGATPTAEPRPDFVVTDDPWFRPVNLQFGPDGALYIADFYNRIIGHYEVPLDHPGRDRTSGRIWRVTYQGTGAAAEPKNPAAPYDLNQADTARLMDELGHPLLARRMSAMDHLTDIRGHEAITSLRQVVRQSDNPYSVSHALWVLHRLGELEQQDLVACAEHSAPLVRIHAMRVLSETAHWDQPLQAEALGGLKDPNAMVRLAAADAMGRHPLTGEGGRLFVEALLELIAAVPESDSHLRHTARMALREQLMVEGNLALLPEPFSESQLETVAGVTLGVGTAEAGGFVVDHFDSLATAAGSPASYLRHAARYAPESEVDEIVRQAEERFSGDPGFQLSLFRALREGVAQRGGPLPEGLVDWGRDLAGRLLASVDPQSLSWMVVRTGGMDAAVPWKWEVRRSSDGAGPAPFLSSLPGGERATSVLRSKSFRVPTHLSFFLAGQSGFPGQRQPIRNFVRLCDSDSKEVLAEAPVPRDDVAQLVEWDLRSHAGRSGYLEAVDGDNGAAYAWLAFARLDPPVVALPEVAPGEVQARRLAALEMIRELRLKSLGEPVRQLLTAGIDGESRAEAARTLAELAPVEALPLLLRLLNDSETASGFRGALAGALADTGQPEARSALTNLVVTAPGELQLQAARALTRLTGGAVQLVDLVEQGRASAQLLLDRSLRERLSGAGGPAWAARLAQLTEDLIPTDEDVRRLLESRRLSFERERGAAQRGAEVFEESCAACHQLNGRGGLVGPQLDGIGNRGLERMIEDILDPNRNVDRAFRSHLFILKNDDVVSGLPRREEGQLVVIADSTGKELRVPKDQIVEQRESDLSLMPENFGDVLPKTDLNDLLEYLLIAGREPDGR